MKKFMVVSIIATLTLASCDQSAIPAATFDKAQPDKIKSIVSFPEFLKGRYLAPDQASTVTIADKIITRHFEFDFKEHKDSLGSSWALEGDTLIDLTEGTKQKVLLKGDTVIQHANWTDTLFCISDDNVLKKFNGYYFLNERYNENTWGVKKLFLKKGILSIGSISSLDEIQKLKEITETKADTMSTNFTLTKRQFKKFVKQDGFSEKETFSRIAKKVR